jgi:hypothetical protein
MLDCPLCCSYVEVHQPGGDYAFLGGKTSRSAAPVTVEVSRKKAARFNATRMPFPVRLERRGTKNRRSNERLEREAVRETSYFTTGRQNLRDSATCLGRPVERPRHDGMPTICTRGREMHVRFLASLMSVPLWFPALGAAGLSVEKFE